MTYPSNLVMVILLSLDNIFPKYFLLSIHKKEKDTFFKTVSKRQQIFNSLSEQSLSLPRINSTHAQIG